MLLNFKETLGFPSFSKTHFILSMYIFLVVIRVSTQVISTFGASFVKILCSKWSVFPGKQQEVSLLACYRTAARVCWKPALKREHQEIKLGFLNIFFFILMLSLFSFLLSIATEYSMENQFLFTCIHIKYSKWQNARYFLEHS